MPRWFYPSPWTGRCLADTFLPVVGDALSFFCSEPLLHFSQMFSGWGFSAHLADMLAACGWLADDSVFGGLREVGW